MNGKKRQDTLIDLFERMGKRQRLLGESNDTHVVHAEPTVTEELATKNCPASAVQSIVHENFDELERDQANENNDTVNSSTAPTVAVGDVPCNAQHVSAENVRCYFSIASIRKHKKLGHRTVHRQASLAE